MKMCWMKLGGHCKPFMHMLVFKRAGMKETGVCCSWSSPGPHPLFLCWLMMLVLAPAADLLRPPALSECLKCASQMFRVYTCWRHHLSHHLCEWGNSLSLSLSYVWPYPFPDVQKSGGSEHLLREKKKAATNDSDKNVPN